jgi:hypothetical protein
MLNGFLASVAVPSCSFDPGTVLEETEFQVPPQVLWRAALRSLGHGVQTKPLYCHLAADGCNGCIREIAIGEDESWIRSGLAGGFRIVVSCGGGYDEQRANGGGGIPSGIYTMTVPGRGVRLHTVPSKRSKWESSRIYLRAQTSPWALLQLAELARTVSPQLSVNKVLD